MGLSEKQLEVYTDPTRFRVVVAGRRFGKAELNTNEILTTEGWKTFETISVGDYVYDEQGLPTKVLAVNPQGNKRILRVHFSDNTYKDVAEDHLWTTWDRESRTFYIPRGDQYRSKDWATTNVTVNGVELGPKARTTKEIQESLYDGDILNHSIPTTYPLEFPETTLPIDPYIYGVWLVSSLSTNELLCSSKLLDLLESKISGAGYTEKSKTLFTGQVYKIGISELGALDSGNKVIQEEYLYGSKEQRRLLLSGMIDFGANEHSMNLDITFSTKNVDIANGVLWLARSLGKVPVLKTTTITLGDKVITKYTVSWKPNDRVIISETDFISYRNRRVPPSNYHRLITNVEDMEYEAPCTCITVESPRHLYLSGRELIPTHNSILSLNELIRAAQTGLKKNVWYVAPTYRQAKTILWPMLKDAIPKSHILFKNETDLELGIKGYKSTISLKGAENADALRGASISFLVMDEVQGIPLKTFDEILYPAMTDQRADGLFIGTPKGKGNNAMYQLYLRGKRFKGWKSWQFTTEQGGNVPKEELEMAKMTMTEKQYRQEFLASFESLQGRIYYNFDLEENVTELAEDNGTTLLVGIDFNVSPMCAVLAVESDGMLFVFDEIMLHDSNTMEVCQKIKDRFPRRDVAVYPDASGKNRSTKSLYGETDHSIIKSNFGFSLYVKNSNPKVSDRINDVNFMLKDAQGTRKLFIHPRCVNLIQSLDGHTYKEGTNDPDKDSGLDHMCDAIGYLVSYRYSTIKKSVKLLEIDWTY